MKRLGVMWAIVVSLLMGTGATNADSLLMASAATGVDALVTSSIYFGPSADIGVVVSKLCRNLA